MAKRLNDSAENQPPTEREIAPDPVATAPVYVPPAPRQMRVERQGDDGAPASRRFPQIRGGVCEFCGIMDKNTPSQYQYKLCPHFRGMQARCSYCPAELDPDQVAYHETLNVAEHPNNPGTLIMWCGKYDCSKKHLERFQTAQ